MIFKPIPPLSGPIGLVVAIGCTIDGVASVLLLVPISTNMKLSHGKWFNMLTTPIGNHVH
jgi:hypothetical protein